MSWHLEIKHKLLLKSTSAKFSGNIK